MKANIQNNVVRKIMEILHSQDGAFYGNLVMKIDEDKQTVLEHLIHMKQQGMIFKDSDGGKFRISEGIMINEGV